MRKDLSDMRISLQETQSKWVTGIKLQTEPLVYSI